MTKRTPEEILKSIEESAVDDEIERVLSMSDEKRRAELRAAGYDIDEVHAEADAFYEKLIGSRVEPTAAPPEKPVAAPAAPSLRPSPRPRTLFLFAAALSAAVSVAVSIPTAVIVLRRGPAAATASAEASQMEPVLEMDVAALRRKSLEACEDTRWVECLYGLDRARHADPAGDADPVVKLARREAAAALRQDPRPRQMDAK